MGEFVLRTSALARRVASRYIARLAVFRSIRLRRGPERRAHLQPHDVAGSNLPDEFKNKFDTALHVKMDFQRTVFPGVIPKSYAVQVADRLQAQARKVVFTLDGLSSDVAAMAPQTDLSDVRDAIRVLDEHGFVPHDRISFEADSWGWTAHEVISRLFDVATG